MVSINLILKKCPMLYKGALAGRGCYSPCMLVAAPKRIGFLFFKRTEEEGWYGERVHLSCRQPPRCQINHISTWSGPGERSGSPASWECQKDPIIIFGKARKSGSVMSLLRITLSIAFLDVWAFQME
uniref:Uncharacterized protein n=1 Tax=Myotis myotis TaxID=51298 RepID=A0A7J7UPI0_MYOMY|nr:hypothetical protein mMyoMyo1_008589 [Myotis myotis]